MNIFLWLIKSSSTELKVILATLGMLFILPIFSVVVIASSGVELFDPDGNKTAEVELSVNWPARGVVTDEFGTHQQWRKDWGLGPHSGIDIGNSVGEPITPFMDGTVAWVDNIDYSACGKGVGLNHDHNITSVYCHLDSATEYPIGTEVGPGDVIGLLGNTGVSTGPHLHFGIRVYGILINPRVFMVGDPEAGNAEYLESEDAAGGHRHEH